MKLWKRRKETPPAHYHIVLIAQVPGTLSCTMGCVRNIETGEPLRIETLDEALEIMAWHADNGRQGYVEVCEVGESSHEALFYTPDHEILLDVFRNNVVHFRHEQD